MFTEIIRSFPALPISAQAAVIIAFIGSSVLISALLNPARKRKRWRIPASSRMLERVASINGFPAKLGYLRNIDPFLFEEMILTAIKQAGYRIQRNSRYTGDGGIDGTFWIGKQRHLIQAKRYSGYIRKSDLDSFDRLCRAKKCPGLFVHTGKTGKGARASSTERVEIVSGQRLLDLLEGRLLVDEPSALNHRDDA